MNVIETLYDAIQRRPRPEDVAQVVLEVFTDLTPTEKRILDLAARNSLKRSVWGYSSMANDFARVVGADKMIDQAAKNFALPDPPSTRECLDVEVVQEFMDRVAALIQADSQFVDFLKHRLDREHRKKAGIEVKKRRYNRIFRTLRRLDSKVRSMIRNGKKYEATRISKSAGATKITKDDLSKDLPTACFVSYLSARMSVRSMFTNASQDRAFDNVADMLFKRAKKSPTVNWWAIALVHPEREVLEKLTDEEKGKLLGMWTETLHMLADLLATFYRENNFDLRNMIVRRGNDSSSWNAAAGAWNKAREHWIALIYAMGLDSILDLYCPGKVLRLMAADVVGWHSYSKGSLDDSLHPDTKVWRDLPFPWEVFEGRQACSKELVELACDTNGVTRSRWVEPPPEKRPVAFTPTRELVNGVTITSPFLAKVLRDANWYKGSEATTTGIHVNVVRDVAGGVLYVEPGTQVSNDEHGPTTPPTGSVPEVSV